MKVTEMIRGVMPCMRRAAVSGGTGCRERGKPAQQTGERDIHVRESTALAELKAGETGVIAGLRSGDSRKMKKLMALGVLPGNRIVLTQNYPAYIFKVGFSEFAIDTAMALEIIVRKINR